MFEGQGLIDAVKNNDVVGFSNIFSKCDVDINKPFRDELVSNSISKFLCIFFLMEFSRLYFILLPKKETAKSLRNY